MAILGIFLHVFFMCVLVENSVSQTGCNRQYQKKSNNNIGTDPIRTGVAIISRYHALSNVLYLKRHCP